MQDWWSKALLVASMVAACRAHEDTTPAIRVVPGAAERAYFLMGHAPHVERPRSKAVRSAEPPSLVEEPEEFVLSNAEVEFRVRRENGALVLAKTRIAKEGNDLYRMHTTCNGREAAFQVSRVFRDGGAGHVVAAMTASPAFGRETLEIENRFTLAGGDRAIRVVTTVTNRGIQPEPLGECGDRVRFRTGNTSVTAAGGYVAFVGQNSAYAFASTDPKMRAQRDREGLVVSYDTPNVIAPREHVQFARVLVGVRNDSASLVAELTRLAAGELGRVVVRGARGRRMEVWADGATVPLADIVTEQTDPVVVELPMGAYTIRPQGASSSAGVRVLVTRRPTAMEVP